MITADKTVLQQLYSLVIAVQNDLRDFREVYAVILMILKKEEQEELQVKSQVNIHYGRLIDCLEAPAFFPSITIS
jgi:hypothetical protein